MPVGHCLHTESEVAPELIEYFPAGHSEHDEDLRLFEYFPDGQEVQLLLPGCEYFPAGHIVQVFGLFAPTWSEKVPPLQAAQPALPVPPAYFPAGHSLHTDDDVAPSVFEYFPDEHFKQAPL